MSRRRLSRRARSEVRTMQSWVRYSFAAIALLLSTTVTAEEPYAATGPILRKCSLVCPDILLRGCCSIYCPKPMPYVPCVCCCCPDDYCCKPCPCIPCYRGGVCDCYCPKACPILCRPIVADYYTCEAGTPCGVCASTHLVNEPPPANGNAPSALRITQPSSLESAADASLPNNPKSFLGL